MEDQGVVRTETEAGVRSIIFSRPGRNNSLTPWIRDELMRAVDAAEADPGVHVMLLRAEGRSFCGGWGLDWATRRQAEQGGRQRVWDSVEDFHYISHHHDLYMKFWYARKPTIAAVQGYCVAGGSDLVLCTDIVIAAEGASFGYPPSRVWGSPLTAMWVYRMGLERAKRYLLTGDEIPAREAARIGLVLETVPGDELLARAMALARRMAQVPVNQLVMLKLLCNETIENMGFASSRTLGRLFDGIARHTQEGLDFIGRTEAVGFRQAVRERDDPFGDYGSRTRS
jgi:enoyl-CoA hydratase